ncbi:NADPH cytochrome P450 oxidoreductase [Myxozyma melibiosi]|uniref:NADPH--cytochrome P450 reductase n=1 Tax=Myxozyma melibiosi TaxID=54550 RepID=A0ABR1FAU6_9ASCO
MANVGSWKQPVEDSLVSTALIAVLVIVVIAYFTRSSFSKSKKEQPASKSVGAYSDRCIVQKLQETNNECVIFYGTQTGNSQDYAEKLAKEAHAKYGLRAMVADLEEYDYETFVNFPEDKLSIFIMSSYGEGEPTDNAVSFFDFVTSESPDFCEQKDVPLQSMRYAAFGLGNSTYEHYNAVIHRVDESLTRLGATRLGPVGEGDDARGTAEEDFMAWKEQMWPEVSEAMHLQAHDVKYEPSFALLETTPAPDRLYLGEHSDDQLSQLSRSSYGPHNPFLAPVVESHELFAGGDRNCLHFEVDLSGSNMTYQTGDHLAVWPMNPSEEVDRFLRVFGLLERRNDVFELEPIDGTVKVPFPTPTTYDAAARYYVEICGAVSRQFMSTLAEFAPADTPLKASLTKLASDKDYFAEVVSHKYLNLAQLLESLTSTAFEVPFTALIEGIRALQPRFYSISSSSLVQREKLSITAVVSTEDVGNATKFYGVNSNYLLAVKNEMNGEKQQQGITYSVSGPRERYGSKVPIYIRTSNFRLPTNKSTPILMIGPGTGVAPFRAFVQEKAAQVKSGADIGKMLLFFGCRRADEDFIYQDEWKEYGATLGDKFEMITAFSRQSAKKVYVQHRVAEYANEIMDVLGKGGYVYVCGDVRMARDVQSTLIQIAGSNGEQLIRDLRKDNRYQEDVW